MKKRSWIAAPLLLACACGSSGGGPDGGNGGTSTGGSSGTDGGNGWQIVTLDPDAGDQSDLALAVGPNDVVGVAYFQPMPTRTASFQDYQIRYAQYAAGQASPPATVQTVQRTFGLSVAFQPSGLPAVAYLGGEPFGGDGGSASHYWVQSQAVLSYSQGDGGWNQVIADDAQNDPVATGASYLATGQVVLGLFPALGFDPTGIGYLFFRDIHFAQDPRDWQDADVKGEVGGPASWTLETAYTDGFNQPPTGLFQGFGGHNRMVVANGKPALICDEFSQTAGGNGAGQNVDFTMRTGPGAWSKPQRILAVKDTQTGPSIAYDPAVGYAVVVYDQDSSENKLLYTSSSDGVSWTSAADLYAGSGGWYPSIAMDPVRHAPAIAYFLCSLENEVSSLSQCDTHEVVVQVQEGSTWVPVTVDPNGGYQPKIGFLSTGKMVIAYRSLPNYQLVLAVQQ